MADRHTSEHPKDILSAWGLSARRRLGQNFLISPELLDRIVELSEVGPGDVALEIGTGLGRLTARLSARAAFVVSVEIDDRLCEVARDRLAGVENVDLINADFLAGKHVIAPAVAHAVARAAEGRPLKVVANLPYKISSPAIINLLEWAPQPAALCVMLQAEVVERLRARPGTRQYGPLTVFAAYWADVEKLLKAPPSAFWPQPRVSSALVRLTARPPAPAAHSYELFGRVVMGLLQNRRKSLGRALDMNWGRRRAEAVIAELGLDGSRRPDSLTPGEFIAIANALHDAGA